MVSLLCDIAISLSLNEFSHNKPLANFVTSEISTIEIDLSEIIIYLHEKLIPLKLPTLILIYKKKKKVNHINQPHLHHQPHQHQPHQPHQHRYRYWVILIKEEPVYH